MSRGTCCRRRRLSHAGKKQRFTLTYFRSSVEFWQEGGKLHCEKMCKGREGRLLIGTPGEPKLEEKYHPGWDGDKIESEKEKTYERKEKVKRWKEKVKVPCAKEGEEAFNRRSWWPSSDCWAFLERKIEWRRKTCYYLLSAFQVYRPMHWGVEAKYSVGQRKCERCQPAKHCIVVKPAWLTLLFTSTICTNKLLTWSSLKDMWASIQ